MYMHTGGVAHKDPDKPDHTDNALTTLLTLGHNVPGNQRMLKELDVSLICNTTALITLLGPLSPDLLLLFKPTPTPLRPSRPSLHA